MKIKPKLQLSFAIMILLSMMLGGLAIHNVLGLSAAIKYLYDFPMQRMSLLYGAHGEYLGYKGSLALATLSLDADEREFILEDAEIQLETALDDLEIALERIDDPSQARGVEALREELASTASLLSLVSELNEERLDFEDQVFEAAEQRQTLLAQAAAEKEAELNAQATPPVESSDNTNTDTLAAQTAVPVALALPSPETQTLDRIEQLLSLAAEPARLSIPIETYLYSPPVQPTHATPRPVVQAAEGSETPTVTTPAPVTQRVFVEVPSGPDPSEINERIQDVYATIEETLTPLTDRFSEQIDISLEQGYLFSDSINQSSRITLYAQIAALVLVALFSVVAAFVLTRSLVPPLNALAQAMSALAKGQLNTDIQDTERPDEIGEMAESLAVFKQSLIERQHMLAENEVNRQKERERLEQEATARKREAEQRQKRTEHLECTIRQFDERIQQELVSFFETIQTMQHTAKQMVGVAQHAKHLSSDVATVSKSSLQSTLQVAHEATEMNQSIHQVAQSVGQSRCMADSAVCEINLASESIDDLTHLAKEIEAITEIISTIASQTNLVALNATVEAARVGEAGRGFAVVATEVKALSHRTSEATSSIEQQITQIQPAVSVAVANTTKIRSTIESIQSLSDKASQSVHTQAQATDHITTNVQSVSSQVDNVCQQMQEVVGGCEEINDAARNVQRNFKQLAGSAKRLKSDIHDFFEEVRHA